VALTILAVLAATALARFLDSRVAAHEANVAALGGAFASAVQMVHGQWQVNGAVPSQDNVAGFGDGRIDVSATGWPTDRAGWNTTPTGAVGRSRCTRLFDYLLSNGPQVSLAPVEPTWLPALIARAHAFSGPPPRDPDAAFWASAPAANTCRFDYQPVVNMRISYNCVTGEVIVDADSGS